MKNEYVNKQKFLEELIKHKAKVQEAKKNNTEPPRVPEYIGSCILAIAENLSRSKNFMGYSYRQEMISDAVENCLQYLDNFDPTIIGKSGTSEPFSYFTQFCYYAFLRRIAKEKKQQYIKAKSMVNMQLYYDLNGEDSDSVTTKFLPNESLNSVIETFEATLEKKKTVKKKKIGLDKILDIED